MRKQALLLSLALISAVPCFAKSPNADDTQGVDQAVNQFYASLNALFTGDVSGMEKIWSHADDITYMGPGGGFQIGWPQVSEIWQRQAALKLGGKVEPYETRVTVSNDLAVVHCYELGNNLDAQKRPIAVSIRATNIFRKENGQWKMIGHHTDLLPALEKYEASPAAE